MSFIDTAARHVQRVDQVQFRSSILAASRATQFIEVIMGLHLVTPGDRAPDVFNVIIEIPMNADPIKYEVDKKTGTLFVDRFMGTAMHYPCNYGYVPHTVAD